MPQIFGQGFIWVRRVGFVEINQQAIRDEDNSEDKDKRNKPSADKTDPLNSPLPLPHQHH